MIKLQRGNKMTKAIERAKQVRPFVKWLGGRTYTVTSRDGQRVYTVRFVVANGHKLAECNCKAGVEGMLCYHVASAAAVNIAIASTRQLSGIPASPSEQPHSAPVAAHVHNHTCPACGDGFSCDEFLCQSSNDWIRCPACIKALRFPSMGVLLPTVVPVTITNGQAHALAC